VSVILPRRGRRSLRDLTDRYRLIAFDNRGAGRSLLTKHPLSVVSMAEDAAQVLDARGV
jgi:pimeloyl-ACP methyl ester carboxylesterase